MDYFISDTHFHHKNIVRGTSQWKESRGDSGQKLRDFDTLEEHDKALVERINERVGEKDTMYHIGDWSFGGIDQIWAFRKQIKCRNIHLILGNHDHHIAENKWLKIPNEDRSIWRDISDNGIALDIRTKVVGEQLYVSAQSLFTTVSERKYISINKQEIVLDHFAGRVWLRSHHGSWNLHGHSHGTLPEMDITGNDPTYIPEGLPLAKQKDVGVDTNNLYPYSFDEIKVIMDRRRIIEIDHHNGKTN